MNYINFIISSNWF